MRLIAAHRAAVVESRRVCREESRRGAGPGLGGNVFAAGMLDFDVETGGCAAVESLLRGGTLSTRTVRAVSAFAAGMESAGLVGTTESTFAARAGGSGRGGVLVTAVLDAIAYPTAAEVPSDESGDYRPAATTLTRAGARHRRSATVLPRLKVSLGPRYRKGRGMIVRRTE